MVATPPSMRERRRKATPAMVRSTSWPSARMKPRPWSGKVTLTVHLL